MVVRKYGAALKVLGSPIILINVYPGTSISFSTSLAWRISNHRLVYPAPIFDFGFDVTTCVGEAGSNLPSSVWDLKSTSTNTLLITLVPPSTRVLMAPSTYCTPLPLSNTPSSLTIREWNVRGKKNSGISNLSLRYCIHHCTATLMIVIDFY